MRHLKDLREYLDVLTDIGEVQAVAREVDWNLEIGAIIRRCYETGAPAPLFERVKDYPPGFRVLGAPAGVSRQAGLSLARIALSLGLEPHSTAREIVEKLAAANDERPLPPREVESAKFQENVLTGDDVDLYKFPTPLIHAGDGGRYINTYGTFVAQTPDKRWTNWSIARAMIVGKTKMSGIVSPAQHIGMIHQMWVDKNEPMPFALALGCAPAIPFVSGMPLPAWVNEADFIGGYLGEALEVVKCRTIDLQVPSGAEIVIEGFLSHTEAAREGPMGEYAGYMPQDKGAYQPVYNVTCIQHRDDPILPVVAAGEPVEENHTAWGIPNSAQVLYELRKAGVAATFAWIPLESAIHWLVVTMPRDWRTRLKVNKADDLIRRIGDTIFSSKAGGGIPKIIVVNDDIDPTNLPELVWAFATRSHPGRGEIFFDGKAVDPLVAYLDKSEKKTAITNKVIYNCLTPDEWGDRVPVRSSFEHLYSKELQDRVVQNWTSYGFRQALG